MQAIARDNKFSVVARNFGKLKAHSTIELTANDSVIGNGVAFVVLKRAQYKWSFCVWALDYGRSALTNAQCFTPQNEDVITWHGLNHNL